jgi:hypothetical protein
MDKIIKILENEIQNHKNLIDDYNVLLNQELEKSAPDSGKINSYVELSKKYIAYIKGVEWSLGQIKKHGN